MRALHFTPHGGGVNGISGETARSLVDARWQIKIRPARHWVIDTSAARLYNFGIATVRWCWIDARRPVAPWSMGVDIENGRDGLVNGALGVFVVSELECAKQAVYERQI